MKNIMISTILALCAGSGAVAAQGVPIVVDDTNGTVTVYNRGIVDSVASERAKTETAQEMSPVEKEKSSSWQTICKGERCYSKTDFRVSESKDAPKVTLFVEKQDGSVRFSVGAPLGVGIQDGIRIRLDKTTDVDVWKAKFSTCYQTMCLASDVIDPRILTVTGSPYLVMTVSGSSVGVSFNGSDVIRALSELK